MKTIEMNMSEFEFDKLSERAKSKGFTIHGYIHDLIADDLARKQKAPSSDYGEIGTDHANVNEELRLRNLASDRKLRAVAIEKSEDGKHWAPHSNPFRKAEQQGMNAAEEYYKAQLEAAGLVVDEAVAAFGEGTKLGEASVISHDKGPATVKLADEQGRVTETGRPTESGYRKPDVTFGNDEAQRISDIMKRNEKFYEEAELRLINETPQSKYHDALLDVIFALKRLI